MIFPYDRPRVFVQVRSAISPMPTSCVVDRDKAYRLEMKIGGMRYRSSAIEGHRTPKYLANPTATAAMVPV